MTRSLRHGGVIRAAISLDFAQPDQPDVVQVLTSGRNTRSTELYCTVVFCTIHD